MKLLFLTPQFPYPPHQGTTIRNFHLIAGLAQHHDVSLLSFSDIAANVDRSPLAKLCQQIQTVPLPNDRSTLQRIRTTLFSPKPDMALRLRSDEFQSRLMQMIQDTKYDIVQFEGIELGQYLRSLRESLQLHDDTQLVFDDHNAEHALQQRAFTTDIKIPQRWPAAGYSLIQWLKLSTYEQAVCYLAHQVVAVSEKDARELAAPKLGILPAVVPNGVDIDFFRPQNTPATEETPANLVYVGKMDYRPNIDAMVWFHEAVFPHILAEKPDVQLTIVGREPHKRISALASHPNVMVTGYVEDIRPFVSNASVYVLPLRMGGGTRLKLLQAMAMHKAIVSTTVGAEGINITSGKELLLADTASAFAGAILKLLDDPGQRDELGAQARQLVSREYSWQSIIPSMDHVYSIMKSSS